MPSRTSVSGRWSTAAAVNSHGMIVGSVTIPVTPISGAVPVQFQSGSYTVLPGGFTGLGEKSAIARTVNDQGWVGGIEGPSTASTADASGVLWIDGDYHQATTLLGDSYAGLFRINDIYAINNRGQLLAAARQDVDGDPATIGWRSVSVRLDPIRSPGDTNYDDDVDFTDLLTLAQHYGQSGNGNVFYETGDFNYDWTVNFDDLLTLAQHYHSADAFDADWALARSLVPEPTVLVLLALGAFASGRTRR